MNCRITLAVLSIGCSAPAEDPLHWYVTPEAEQIGFARALDRWHQATGLDMSYEVQDALGSAVPWNVTVDNLKLDGDECGRASLRYGWIILRSNWLNCQEWAIEHEMMHALSKRRGHPESGVGAKYESGSNVLDAATVDWVCDVRTCAWRRPESE